MNLHIACMNVECGITKEFPYRCKIIIHHRQPSLSLSLEDLKFWRINNSRLSSLLTHGWRKLEFLVSLRERLTCGERRSLSEMCLVNNCSHAIKHTPDINHNRVVEKLTENIFVSLPREHNKATSLSWKLSAAKALSVCQSYRRGLLPLHSFTMCVCRVSFTLSCTSNSCCE